MHAPLCHQKAFKPDKFLVIQLHFLVTISQYIDIFLKPLQRDY